jgi:TetR/AcrR family transcriptional regulator, transcriptional repressor for nem operon
VLRQAYRPGALSPAHVSARPGTTSAWLRAAANRSNTDAIRLENLFTERSFCYATAVPKPPRQSRHDLLTGALHHFWTHGYAATSIGDLVDALGTSRAALYAEFDGKDGLFIECLNRYRDAVVTPAFAPVEAPGADPDSIVTYFEFQITQGEQRGLPGPGCLFANTMTELAPHNPAINSIVRTHHERLRAGFLNALSNSVSTRPAQSHLPRETQRDRADMLATFAHGLWSYSRTVHSAATLRRSVHTILHLLQ